MPTYHQPTSLDDALRIYATDPSLKILAGGTDIYPAKTTRAGWGDMNHPGILDISRIPDLSGITLHTDHWRIGATTTWSSLIAANLPPAFDGLKSAARDIGGRQIQNRASIAGNIATASPAGDSIPCLLVLNAAVILASPRGERNIPIHQFIDGYRHTTRAADEIITAITIPKQSGRGAFIKFGARRYLVISIAMVAANITQDDAGRITDAAIAVGACSPVAQRLPHLEQRLLGQIPNAALITDADLAHLAPIDDIRATGTYRRAAALQLLRDLMDSYRAQSTTEAA